MPNILYSTGSLKWLKSNSPVVLKVQSSSAQKNKETEPAKIYNFPPTPDQRKLRGKK